MDGRNGWKEEFSYDVVTTIGVLKDAKLKNPENEERVRENGQYARKIGAALQALITSSLVDQENFEQIISHASCADFIANELYRLQKPTQNDFDNVIKRITGSIENKSSGDIKFFKSSTNKDKVSLTPLVIEKDVTQIVPPQVCKFL